MRILIFILLLTLIPLPLLSASQVTRTQVLMGDVPVSITVEIQGEILPVYEAMEKAFTEVRRLERGVSEWRPESQASLLNKNAGKRWVPIGRDLLQILLKAREVSEETNGGFDITFASHKRGVGYRNVSILPELGLAYLDRGVKIGVSGIAKGYIVDRMAQTIRRAGFSKFLINAGDLYAGGQWQIDVKNPFQESGPSPCTLSVKDRAVSTSGTYERGPHIIDPATHRPPAGLASVTVIAKNSVDADALATGLFVLGGRGSDSLKKVLHKLKGVDAVLIDSKGHLETFGPVSGACRGRLD